MRISDYFDAITTQWPKAPALIDGDLTIDFATAQRFVHAAANALANEPKLPTGSHIAVYAPNDYRVPLLLLAINRADMVWLAAHTRNPVEVNAQVLSFMDCQFVFFHSAYEDLVPRLKESLTQAVRFICIDKPSVHGDFLDDWMAPHWKPFPSVPEDPNATCFLQPTGGTTGPSKAAVHTHRSFETCTLIGCIAREKRAGDRFLASAPLTHAAGFMALQTMVAGGTVVVLSAINPETILDGIEKYRISHLFVPPTLLYMLMAHPKVHTTNLSSLRSLSTGSAPVAPDKYKLAVELFGPVIYEGYGQTECMTPVTLKSPADYLLPDGSFDEATLRSAGRPTFGTFVAIMDEQGNILPPGKRGEIVVRSSMVMREYYKNPEDTAAFNRLGWCHTGDVGVQDERGYLTIVDRMKDMIVTGGFNVFPAQIEAVVGSHPAVLDCAVVGVQDEKWGEAVKAVVQLRPGMSLTADEVMALCHEKLGGVYTPKSVEFWDDLPRSPVGKVLRRTIRDHFWKGQWRSV